VKIVLNGDIDAYHVAPRVGKVLIKAGLATETPIEPKTDEYAKVGECPRCGLVATKKSFRQWTERWTNKEYLRTTDVR
jgi:hypothetical protein